MKVDQGTQTDDSVKVPELISITPNLIHINDLLPFMCILQLHMYCVLLNKSVPLSESVTETETVNDRENIIYVLQCKDGKYYVGKTGDLDRRLQSHISGCGSFWTKKYPYVKVEEVIRNPIKSIRNAPSRLLSTTKDIGSFVKKTASKLSKSKKRR